MAEWSKPSAELLDDALRKIWSELDSEVAEQPSFDSVVGLDSSTLMKHAVQAVATYLGTSNADAADPTALIHVYTLGFVVGMKYGEARSELSNITSHERQDNGNEH